MQTDTDIIFNVNGFIEPIPPDELEEIEVFAFDREQFNAKMEEIDREIIAGCNTRIWYNPSLYTPTEREKNYVVGMIHELDTYSHIF